MAFTAKFPGVCDNCGGRIEPGDDATYEDDELIHARCLGNITTIEKRHPGNPAQTFIE